jgi:predicted ATPase
MLSRLNIENLGSIRSATLDISPLTVLLGANASGKTTLLRSVELYAALREHQLPEVRFGGQLLSGSDWVGVVHQGDETRRIGFAAFLDRGSSQGPDATLEIGIDWEAFRKAAAQQLSSAAREVLFLAETFRSPSGALIEREEADGHIELPTIGDPIVFVCDETSSMFRSVQILGAIPPYAERLRPYVGLVKSFGEAKYFRPNGQDMTAAASGNAVLPTGAGFVEALAALQNEDAEAFSSIVERLRGLFPHIRKVLFRVVNQTRHLIFETDRSSVPTPADLEAEGVLTTLFLLWAGATMPPDSVLLIDEPEAGLHPHLMGRRVEFLRRLAEGQHGHHPMRVVVATQSVDFVRWVDVPEIRVVEHHPSTGTTARSVPESESLRTVIDRFEANVGDLWYSGALGATPGTSR